MRLTFLSLGLALVTLAAAAADPDYTRTEDVIYGRKFGTALTMDVFQPAKPNGYGILWMVSGGFFSAKEAINPKSYAPFLDRGYTVFAIVHGSQPRYIIPEIIQDIHRAARYVHKHAARYGVDPEKLGIAGGSAGGHLSLTLGTQGGPGPADAKDPLDRESSAVAAVACFFPPTDFVNWGEPGEDGCGFGRTAAFKPAFGPRSDTAEGRQELSREISPIHYVTARTAPTLIVHGDADKLVPIYQAEIFQKKAKENGVACEIVVREGKDHGWAGIENDMALFADWFDQYLRGLPPKAK